MQTPRDFFPGSPFNLPDLDAILRRCSCGAPTPDGAALCPACYQDELAARKDD